MTFDIRFSPACPGKMGLSIIIGVSLLILGNCLAENATTTEKVPVEKLKVEVYYETLCGDSKRFITRQLYPVKTSSLGEYFDVEFVPYGKATTTGSSGSYGFTCQHGQKECDGNKMHACALKHVNSTELKVEFIHCSMSTKSPPKSLPECAEKLQVNTTDIEACIEGEEGDELLASNGRQTHALRPKLYFVPWIRYNKVFTEENLENSQHNFKSVLCAELKKSEVNPPECEATVEKWGARRA